MRAPNNESEKESRLVALKRLKPLENKPDMFDFAPILIEFAVISGNNYGSGLGWFG